MPPLEFSCVSVQMLCADMVVSANNPALEQCPVGFNPVGARHISDVLTRAMPNRVVGSVNSLKRRLLGV